MGCSSVTWARRAQLLQPGWFESIRAHRKRFARSSCPADPPSSSSLMNNEFRTYYMILLIDKTIKRVQRNYFTYEMTLSLGRRPRMFGLFPVWAQPSRHVHKCFALGRWCSDMPIEPGAAHQPDVLISHDTNDSIEVDTIAVKAASAGSARTQDVKPSQPRPSGPPSAESGRNSTSRRRTHPDKHYNI